MATSRRPAVIQTASGEEGGLDLLIPEEEKKKVWTLLNGKWVETVVEEDAEEEDLASLIDEEDMGILSSVWHEGRGKFMEAKWLHLDEKYSGKWRMKGWVPVDPKDYSDPRYRVLDKPGLGKVITYMDNYLAEMPRVRAEGIRKAQDDFNRNDRVERLYGLNVDQSSEKYDDYAALTVKHKEHGAENLHRDLPTDAPLFKTMRDLEARITAMGREAEAAERLRANKKFSR